MSLIKYVSFPRKLNIYTRAEIKGREKELGFLYDINEYRRETLLFFPDISPEEDNIYLSDKEDATFQDCFVNKYIYELRISLPYHNRHIEIIKGNEINDEDKLKREMEELKLYYDVESNRRLCKFVSKHIKQGEFVEIYTERTDHVDFNFGPPSSVEVVNLNDCINNKVSFKKNVEKHKVILKY